MRTILLSVLVAMTLGAAGNAFSSTPSKETAMKVQLKVGTTTVVVALVDNPTAQDFFSMLPLKVTLEDYASSEKVAYLPRKLSTTGAPKAVTPVRGDIAYYAPWGNVALYYRDGPHSPGLVPLGRIESGLEALEAQGSPTVLIEKAAR